MLLRNVLVLLIIFLLFSPVKAMEPQNEVEKLEKVIIHRSGFSEHYITHIALETDEYYMSVHSNPTLLCLSIPIKDTDYFAPSYYKIDQEIIKMASFQKSVPRSTLTLMLGTKPMNALWEEMNLNAEPKSNVFGKKKTMQNPDGYILNNLKNAIIKDEMKNSPTQRFDITDITPVTLTKKLTDITPVTLTEKFLYKGNIYNPSTISIENPEYFQTKFTQIEKPLSSRKHFLGFPALDHWIKQISLRQKLVEIHQHIVKNKMNYLNTLHEEEILEILEGEDLEEVKLNKIYQEYLPKVQQEYETFKNSWTPTGLQKLIWGVPWKEGSY